MFKLFLFFGASHAFRVQWWIKRSIALNLCLDCITFAGEPNLRPFSQYFYFFSCFVFGDWRKRTVLAINRYIWCFVRFHGRFVVPDFCTSTTIHQPSVAKCYFMRQLAITSHNHHFWPPLLITADRINVYFIAYSRYMWMVGGQSQ